MEKLFHMQPSQGEAAKKKETRAATLVDVAGAAAFSKNNISRDRWSHWLSRTTVNPVNRAVGGVGDAGPVAEF